MRLPTRAYENYVVTSYDDVIAFDQLRGSFNLETLWSLLTFWTTCLSVPTVSYMASPLPNTERFHLD